MGALTPPGTLWVQLSQEALLGVQFPVPFHKDELSSCYRSIFKPLIMPPCDTVEYTSGIDSSSRDAAHSVNPAVVEGLWAA